jgi:hypothetical protein
MDWSSSAENVNQYFMLKNTKVMIHRKIVVITAVNNEIWSACFFLKIKINWGISDTANTPVHIDKIKSFTVL